MHSSWPAWRSAGLAAAVLPAGPGRAPRTAPPRRRVHRGRGRDAGYGLPYGPDAGGHPGLGHELYADTVDVTGDGVERLTATAAEAAERGPGIWLQPTVGDVPERDVREHLAETGRFAERLRRHGAAVDFSWAANSGCSRPGPCPATPCSNASGACSTAGWTPSRSSDRVDWRLFDIVGIDYYAYFPDKATAQGSRAAICAGANRWPSPSSAPAPTSGRPRPVAWAGTSSTTTRSPRRSRAIRSAASAPRRSTSANSSTCTPRRASTRRRPSSS